MKTIKVALVGVGNASAGLIQSIIYYRENKDLHSSFPLLGGFAVSDIEIVAAFDVTKEKVGKPLYEAIFAQPNKCPKYVDDPSKDKSLSKLVLRGSTLDGIADIVQDIITESNESTINVVEALKSSGAEMVICLLPSGADKAVEFYAQAAIDASCAFINATPTLIASKREWAQKFKKANIPLVGDDLQSLTGGTRIHKGMLQLLDLFGVGIKDTYQLDVSGGAEGKNTLDPQRRMMKREIKTESIKKILPHLSSDHIASGTTDYLDFLGNRRHSYFWIEGETFLGAPLIIDMNIKTFDGPNAAATLVNVIRATKIALDRAIDGPLMAVSAFGFKHAPVYYNENEATKRFKEFIEGTINS